MLLLHHILDKNLCKKISFITIFFRFPVTIVIIRDITNFTQYNIITNFYYSYASFSLKFAEKKSNLFDGFIMQFHDNLV